MNWYIYLPPLFSIYLIFISKVYSRSFRYLVQSHLQGKSLESNADFVTDVALDYATRLGFYSTIFSAIISILVIALKLKQPIFPISLVIFLVVILAPMWFWIIRFPPGELVSTLTKILKIPHANIVDFILIVVNIILVIAIWYSQCNVTQA